MTNPLALVIEDDEDLSFIFSEALQAAGFAPEILRTGDEAMTRLASAQPAIVVLDLHLPNVAGTEILDSIRGDRRLGHTRVAVVSADARMADLTRAQADLVLIKPVSFSLLRDLSARFKSLTVAGPS